MKFLTAQPDSSYFFWQLDLQLENFESLAVEPDDIHVLIGVSTEVGAGRECMDFIARNKPRANFFVYPDARCGPQYPSSIRPCLIKQHLAAYPLLESETFLYIDSDVVFRELPDLALLCKDEIWYVSDTKAYIGAGYLQRFCGDYLIEKMCDAVGISPAVVLKNDAGAGGAQYLIKNATYEFWEKVEEDSEKIYRILSDFNTESADSLGIRRGLFPGVQAWCSDMWALLYNAWFFGKDVRIHPELDFCWPDEDISRWSSTKILHYAGAKSEFFDKTKYQHYSPFFDPAIDKVDQTCCGWVLMEQIRNMRRKLERERVDLADVTFLIPVRIDHPDRLENIDILTKFLSKHFKTTIIIKESDSESRAAGLPAECEYEFCEDKSELFHRTKFINELVRKASTAIVGIWDTDAIVDIDQIQEAISMLRSGQADMVYPYDGRFVSIDDLSKKLFNKFLDSRLFIMNQGKFVEGMSNSVGGAFFVKRECFLRAGGENQYFTSWGPEDKERYKRMMILGMRICRIKGPLFHLPHHRGINSSYAGDSRRSFMREYLKIASMGRKHLRQYIRTWPWYESDR